MRLNTNFFIKSYRVTTALISFFIDIFLLYRKFLKKENELSLRQKTSREYAKKPTDEHKFTWIHAVSIGETHSAITVAEIILKKDPNQYILLTTSTISSSEIINKIDNERIIHQYLPLDVQKYVNKFINYWSPSVCIFMEAEIWPNYFLEIEKRKIPLFILNARLTEKSYNRWNKFPKFAKKILNIPRLISCQDNETYERYKSLEVARLTKSENIKYANKPLSVDDNEFNSLDQLFSGHLVYTIVSAHDKEGEIFLSVHKQLHSIDPNTVCIYVPRHPSGIIEIIDLLDKDKISWTKLPSQETNKNEHNNNINFYIVDKFGVLGTYLKLSKLAIIGGSFIDIGGHNPIEAVQLNCPVFHGSYTRNFHEVYRELGELDCCNQSDNKEDLIKKIKLYFSNIDRMELTRKNIKNIIDTKRLSVENEINDILSLKYGDYS